MADEQAQVETTTEETQQTPEEQTGSEAVETPESTGKGDINEALRQERERYRKLQEEINSPDFIYSKARELGLTEEQAEQVEQTVAPQGMSYSDYEYFKSLDQSKEKFPDLATDLADQIAVTALMKELKLTPLAAAEKYYSKINKVVEAAKVEGAKEQQAVISEKENAQTVTSTTTTNSEQSEYDELLRRSRNQMNPKDAEKAHLDLIMWKEKNRK